MVASSTEINISDVIESGSIVTHFQPITSIRRKAVVGIEALSRSIAPDGTQVSPAKLFALAETAGLTLELDRVCREQAMKSFLPLHKRNPDMVLFINLHSEAVTQDTGSHYCLTNFVQRIGLDPRNVAVEILESEFKDIATLRTAVEHYKSRGFLVALDDLGVGHSNLDRIAHIKPDLLKVDRSLLSGIHLDFYKQEIFKAIVMLSERIGGWTISEGIEEQAEAITALDLGGDMLQGYYFARPGKLDVKDVQPEYNSERIEDTAANFKAFMVEKFERLRARREDRISITKFIAAQLQSSALSANDISLKLRDLIASHANIESACILNLSGVQVGDTSWHTQRVQNQKTIIFHPPTNGTDHSLKEYYYLLPQFKDGMYETAPYVPLPSGDLCITVTALFEIADGQFILCLHIKAASVELHSPVAVAMA